MLSNLAPDMAAAGSQNMTLPQPSNMPPKYNPSMKLEQRRALILLP